MSKLNEISHIKIGTILGYECYVPQSYYNPISFLNKNCPIWIKINNDGTCEVMFIGDNNAYVEISQFIKSHLEKRDGYYFKPIVRDGVLPISCQIINQDDNVCSEIIVSKDFIVKSIILGKQTEKDLLHDYFLSDYNLKGYDSKVLRFDKNTIHTGKALFNVLKDEVGFFIQLD